MTKPAVPGPVLRVADLVPGQDVEVRIEPDQAALAAIAGELELLGLRKLRFEGRLSPMGKRDWRLTAHLGATVVQPCVVTLKPVTTRIEEDVSRAWVAGYEAPEGDEVEMPGDVDLEPLGATIDLNAVMVEALALALPLYPRAGGAEAGEAVFTEPGKDAMTDEAARPFAGLAALRNKLPGGESGGDSGADSGGDNGQ